jgi:hypothetical protein
VTVTQQPQPLDLHPIESRAAEATEGSWHNDPEYGPNFIVSEINGYQYGIGDLAFGEGEQADADREFVLNARQDVLLLVDEVHRLRAELAPYDALQLGHPDGRISTTCTAGKHPTWLRYPDDTRYYACPWCDGDRLRAELAQARQKTADEIRAYCPDHGTADTCRMDCHCAIADELTHPAPSSA